MDFFKKAKSGLKDAQDVAKMLGIDKMSLGDKNKSESSAASPSPAAPAPSYAAAPSSAVNGSGPASSAPKHSTPEPAHAGSVNTTVVPSSNPNAPKKLPMMARKSIRDNFEAKKHELETQLSEMLGTPWTVFVDVANVYSYTAESYTDWARENPGAMFYRYFEGTFYRIRSFVEANGADGVAQLNALASGHVMTLEPGEPPIQFKYCSCDISGGKLRLLFTPKYMGTNVDNCLENLPQVVNAAGSAAGEATALSLVARSSIRNEYDAGVEEIRADAKRQLKADYDLIFTPNFEDTFAKLKSHIASLDDEDKQHPLDDNFDSLIGRAVLSYFRGFSDTLKYKGFRKDEMMQEAFGDAVDTHEIVFRIDDTIPGSRRNDCIIEEGRLVIRTKLTQFYVNTSSACEAMVDLL